MYYILNQTQQIIAADHLLLSYLNLNSLEDLTKKIIFNELRIVASTDTEVEIYTKKKVLHFTSKTISLASMFGKLTLVAVVPKETIPTDITQHESTLDTLNSKHINHHFTLTKKENDTKSHTHSIDDIEKVKDSTETLTQEEKRILEDSHTALHSQSIVINALQVSNQIGISTDDYSTFLDEYIDTASSLKSDLQNHDITISNRAIDTLSHLAEILHLTEVTPMLSKLSTQSSQERTKTIEVFYTLLSRFTIQIDATPIETDPKELTHHTHQERQGFSQIQLTDVDPIPFDFHLSQAADDLSLPIELVEEFVHDFIEQAHSETKKMLHAYEKGDLESIQQIGYHLKSVSGNLYITTLSDTLNDIQLCEDPSKLKKLIQKYWGQFLSFEQQINTK